MKFASRLIITALVYALCIRGEPARASVDYWKISEVQVGWKGYGLSTFDGVTPKRFEVEIIGFDADQKGQLYFLARISGGPNNIIDRATNVVAGMSGSPIYVNDKLVGALRYGWEYAKEPIPGITPFEYMYNQATAASASAPPYSPQDAALISSRFSPGSAITISAVKGDITMSPSGTVTTVDEETGIIYAFGHPFLNAGAVSYPAWRSAVSTVMPSVKTSFKIPDPRFRGAEAEVFYDGEFGIYARAVSSSRKSLVPVRVRVTDERGNEKVTDFEMIRVMPMFEALNALLNSILSDRPPSFEPMALRVNGQITFFDLPPVSFERVLVGLNTNELYGADSIDKEAKKFSATKDYLTLLNKSMIPYLGIDALERLDFSFTFESNPKIYGIGDAYVRDVNGEEIENIYPGDTLRCFVVLGELDTNNLVKSFTQISFKFKVPEDSVEGKVAIYVQSFGIFSRQDPSNTLTPSSREDFIERTNQSFIPAHVIGIQVLVNTPLTKTDKSNDFLWVRSDQPGARPFLFDIRAERHDISLENYNFGFDGKKAIVLGGHLTGYKVSIKEGAKKEAVKKEEGKKKEKK